MERETASEGPALWAYLSPRLTRNKPEGGETGNRSFRKTGRGEVEVREC